MGMAKIAFGVLVVAVGIFVAIRLFGLLVRWGQADVELARGNVAEGVLQASAIFAFGILAQHAVRATFSAIDLSFHGERFSGTVLVTTAIYGLIHVGVAFLVGAVVLGAGTWLFTILTRHVDEMAEVRKGNVAPALVLGAVIIVLAMVTSGGLETALEGLLPLPELGRDVVITPS